MNTLKSSILTVLVIVTMTLAINISQAKALTLRFA